MEHLFITIHDTYISFQNGSDPAHDDTERLKVIINLIKYYGKNKSVEIRDERTI